MRTIPMIWLCGLLAACSASPTAPTAVASPGSSGERVSALGAPPPSSIGPGAGTGTLPTLGAPNSCPSDRPIVSVNGNNGKVDVAVTRIAGQTRSYEWEVERDQANVYKFLLKLLTDVNDGRGGLYAQPPTLRPGLYRVRARAVRTGCGASDNGTWSEWAPFSIYGPPDNPEAAPVEPVDHHPHWPPACYPNCLPRDEDE
jgi:hypothetical protein